MAASKSRSRSGAPVVGEDVGRRLRAHREQSNLSLRELARRLGISPSAISQIETGKSRPSVSTLYSITSELGMSLDELFTGSAPESSSPPPVRKSAAARPTRESAATDGAAASDVAGAARHVQRADGRQSIDLESGVRWERLTPLADPGADFLYVTYDIGGASSESTHLVRHSGREYGLVLSGSLEVTVGFDTYVLGPGDSVCFDSTVPHRLRNAGDEPVNGVWFVIGRQSDARALVFDDARED